MANPHSMKKKHENNLDKSLHNFDKVQDREREEIYMLAPNCKLCVMSWAAFTFTFTFALCLSGSTFTFGP